MADRFPFGRAGGISVLVLLSVAVCVFAAVGLPSGYYDIPAGYDFPADSATLEKYRTDQNVRAQRLHVWNVFAGMTQPTPDGKYAIWETWFSEDETFQAATTTQAVGPRRIMRQFRQPRQFRPPKGVAAPEAAGSALLSFVLYNYSAYNHIRTHQLNVRSALNKEMQQGTPDPKVPGDRMITDFPHDALSLKTIWWPVAKDKATPMPVWDPESNPKQASGNGYRTWPRVVVIDPVNSNVPPNQTMSITFLGKDFPNSHVVGLSAFHYVVLDAQTAANAMANGQIATFAQQVLHRGLQAGDYTVFAGTHLTTKEIGDWVWATFWWHDRPSEGPYASDRPPSVQGKWANYLMNASYDLNLPRESDQTSHITFNPWLEAGFADGIESNCMNCHNRASWQAISFLPIFRGDADLKNDPAFARGRLRTDFLWSIPFDAH